ncbi:phosphoribosyltransferase [Sphaerimonospora cavernae]|uniref:Phosphoribosyltransferase n=1 Tax=Sphaerimonospora cavernae TaxID=1740611 RepID=A0ABV6U9D4_9ACTN
MSVPQPDADLRVIIRARLGAIMRNPTREPNVTCEVCAVPVERQYSRCYRCHQDLLNARVPVAQRVVPLTYAVYGEQSNSDMHRYKDPMPDLQRSRNASFQRVLLLVLGFALNHAECIDHVTGMPVTRLVTVPSLRGRPGRHPLALVSEALPLHWKRVDLQAVPGVPEDRRRTINPDHFLLPAPQEVRGQHVVILEDTWVQGGHAQSAAASVLRAGAAEVTVVAIARRIRLDSQRSTVEKHLHQILQGAEYNIEICPVTGGPCP